MQERADATERVFPDGRDRVRPSSVSLVSQRLYMNRHKPSQNPGKTRSTSPDDAGPDALTDLEGGT